MIVGEIEKLLKEFYEGKTTEEQEEMLKKYFATETVPDQLLIDKKIFLDLQEMSVVDVPCGLEAKITQLIDGKAEEEKRFLVKNKLTFNRRWLVGIAASLILLFGVGYGVLNLHPYSEPKDTFSNPQEAYDAIQAALIEVSSSLNDGMAQLIEVKQDVSEIHNIIIQEIQ